MPANSNDCPVNKIDSNVVGSSFAEERCIGVLPDSDVGSPGHVAGDRAGGVWRPFNPNEFDDFGGETSMTAREPINDSRQEEKGVVTDLEASGGFNQDMTHGALQRPMQGFFFADAHELPNSAPISDSTVSLITLTSVAPNTITLGTGGGAKINVGDLIMLSGMQNTTNNQSNLRVSGVAGDALTVDGGLVAENATAGSRVEVVGHAFSSGVLGIEFSASEQLLLTLTTGSFIDHGINVGEWIFILSDPDNPGNSFDNNGGYARVEKVEAGSLTLKEPTWTPVTEAGVAGKSIRVYRGVFMRNEDDPSLIKRRSYHLERTLGQDNDGVQSELLVGAVADEFTMNLTTADKMTCDLSFMALNNELRSGADGLKPGDRTNTLKVEDAFNTSSDVYQLRLFVNDPLKATPKSLYAKVMEATISIANNASGNKCIGTLGSFDITVGNFVVTGEIEAYFSTVAAVKAVKQNADAGFNLIATKDNTGFIYDIPLLSLGGGRVNVEKDEPTKLPLEKKGAKNHMGYTLGATYFNYLPTVAMATIE